MYSRTGAKTALGGGGGRDAALLIVVDRRLAVDDRGEVGQRAGGDRDPERAEPSSLPCIDCSTRPVALAAPVEVGMMLMAAAAGPPQVLVGTIDQGSGRRCRRARWS